MSKRIVLKLTVPLLLIAISALVAPPGQAAAKRYRLLKKSMRYEAAFDQFSLTGSSDPTCDAKGRNCRLAQDGTVDIGGVRFSAIGGPGKASVTVAVKDDTNLYGRVPISVCQDLNGNSMCGDLGEPVASGCLAPGKTIALAAVRTKEILVFISAFDGCPDLTNIANSQGGATSGLVTLTALLPL